jgi:RNA polymerase sigma factor (sigma-70 family)
MNKSEADDRDLVYRARSGDGRAFGRLIERYQSASKSIAIRMVANEDIALDLVQESVLQALLSLDNLRDPEAFRSWLLGIVINVCRGYLRDRETGFLSLENLPDAPGTDAFGSDPNFADPEGLVEERDLHTLLLDAVNGLSPSLRQAVFLYYYRRLSVQEIAAMAGVSAGVIKVRLHRARKRLRTHLLMAYPDIDWVISPEQRRQTMIEVSIADILHLKERYIVVLIDKAGHNLLPIWIGPPEALQIALGLRNHSLPRPLTIRFMANTLAALEVELVEARVEALKEETFYGVAKLRQGEREIDLDARPSDVLALAAHTGSPIYVGEEVMQAAGIEISEAQVAAFQPGKGLDGLIKEFEDKWQKGLARGETGEERQRGYQELLAALFGGLE